jgi:arylsulfatase A-like enzyme
MRHTIFLLILISFISACSQRKVKEDDPNIIFIVCDDLNDAIKPLAGHPQAVTPNLEKLADMGVNFTNAQVNSPICGPSRASFLTGLYPHTTGYFGYNFIEDHWRNNPTLGESITMMEHFRNHGYHVIGTGKIFHNSQEDWTVWDEFGVPPSWGPWPWDGTPDDAFEFDSLSPWRNSVVHPGMPPSFGIDDQFGSIDDVPVVPADPANDIPGYAGWRLFFKDFKYEGPADRDLMPDELNAQWVKEKLNENHKKPFLMCVGINRPHSPMWAPQEFFDMFGLDTLQLAEALENDDMDCADAIIDSGRLSTGIYGRVKYNKIMNAGGKEFLKEWTQAYLANVAFLDAQIGVIMNALENSKYAENTYIFFTSDHGYHMGEKDWLFKNSVWEESARVPLLVAGPEIQKSKQCAAPVSLIDLFPTFIDLANLPVNVNSKTNRIPLDGHSLLPLMLNPENDKWEGPDVALTAVASNTVLELGEPGKIEDQFYSVRSKHYRYVLCPNGEEELYHHQTDPYEWNNLANNSNYINVKTSLRNQLMKILNSNGHE